MKTLSLKSGLVLALLCSFAPLVCRANVSSAGSQAPSGDVVSQVAPTQAQPTEAFAHASVATGSTGEATSLLSGIQLSLAMADFTGDTHPDLATVNLAQFDPFQTQYFIDVQLTKGGRQSLRLTALPGGLFITPKDVTGDGTLDLIVRATISHAVVAIFLNDGYGRFSSTESIPFSRAADADAVGFELAANQPISSAPMIAQSPQQTDLQDKSRARLEENGTQAPGMNAGLAVSLFALFQSNRAPPLVA
jgi:hypothetical protein